ncbi:MAG: FAD-dependent oxidoreductase [Kiritimatiellae bacterium]|nr:FAD-dependent oxidoreductase [Kiritimatiellia bacterium]
MKRVIVSAAIVFSSVRSFAVSDRVWDVVIYGSSPAAISAAVQARRMGVDAVVVSPDKRIGGLTSGGLGQTDIGNKRAFGGIALEFYRAVADWYRDDSNWKHEKRGDYLPDGQCAGSQGGDSMWTFEPSAALAILEGWERRLNLTIVRGERLDRGKGGVNKKNGRIQSFRTLSGRTFSGRIFVDATYEGDLMAAAGVSYKVGRESNELYGETLSGCQRARARSHQFAKGVSAYVIAGDRTSGLLPGLEFDDNRPDGTGDSFVQAYCFRMCLTDNPENRIPFKKPEGYDERQYELLFRQLEARGEAFYRSDDPWRLPWINSRMPNRKTDTNNRDGFSSDFVGRNWAWPEASYEERERIFKAHLDYQRGLMWTLANHPRVFPCVREAYSRWGTCRDEFVDGSGDGWQSQLYVREARRMIGEYVMTEANCRGRRVAERPVAMGAYGMDSHHVRRLVDAEGNVFNEGDVQVHRDEKGNRYPPYPIDFGALLPKRAQCTNLLVPVCVSASHIAFGSIRMEPVFFALGQAAGTTAVLALKADCDVQDVNYVELRRRLISDGQVLGISSGSEGQLPTKGIKR